MLKIKISLIITTLLAILVLLPAGVLRADSVTGELQNGAQGAGAQSTTTCNGNTVGPQNAINCKITTVVNILSSLVGVVAVIMIIIGGFRYITSAGDSNKVSGAKNTIIYALIGLVIVALAQIIVQFVLKKVT